MFLFLSFNLYKNQVVIAFFLLYFCFFSLITNITAEYFECKFYPFPPSFLYIWPFGMVCYYRYDIDKIPLGP